MSIDDDFEEEFPEEDLEEELDMFVEAQDAVWGDVVAELKAEPLDVVRLSPTGQPRAISYVAALWA